MHEKSSVLYYIITLINKHFATGILLPIALIIADSENIQFWSYKVSQLIWMSRMSPN